MLDAQSIKQMDGKAKLQALEELGALAMPGATNEAIAERMGYARRSYQGWKEVPDRIPVTVLLLLQEWAWRGDKDTMARRTFAEVAESFGKAATDMQRLAEVFGSKP